MNFAEVLGTDVLKPGDTGDKVKWLQSMLLRADYDPAQTGVFDDDTEWAVKDVQAQAGVAMNGIVEHVTAVAVDVAAGVSEDTLLEALRGEDPPWLVLAGSLLGIYEIPGSGDNQTILDWAQELGGMIAREYKHDAIPWCQLFVQYCLFKSGQPHLDSLWALDSAKYGVKLKGAARGAVACKSRNGGGHTFFIVGRTASGLLVGRGGNQSDMVCDATFDPGIVVSYNWSTEWPAPDETGFDSLPLVKPAPRSKHED